MPLRLHNALTGRVEDFEPAVPPGCRLRVWSSPDVSSLGGLRLARFCALAPLALEHLGLQVTRVSDLADEADIHLGLREPPQGRALLWLKPDPRVEGEDAAALRERGFDDETLALAFLGAGYREALKLGPAELEGAREDALRLKATANFLRSSRGGSAPNVQALAGYKKRLRDALSRDLDLPAAVQCLWDALRPGALSPGSQLAFLKEACGVLDLRLL